MALLSWNSLAAVFFTLCRWYGSRSSPFLSFIPLRHVAVDVALERAGQVEHLRLEALQNRSPGVGQLSIAQHLLGDSQALLQERMHPFTGPLQQRQDHRPLARGLGPQLGHVELGPGQRRQVADDLQGRVQTLTTRSPWMRSQSQPWMRS